ncbi:MAG TPA: hypothetical protein VN720_09250 [Rudaea sp.]|nr:hypothetical protein [Rudaea sp.]
MSIDSSSFARRTPACSPGPAPNAAAATDFSNQDKLSSCRCSIQGLRARANIDFGEFSGMAAPLLAWRPVRLVARPAGMLLLQHETRPASIENTVDNSLIRIILA